MKKYNLFLIILLISLISGCLKHKKAHVLKTGEIESSTNQNTSDNSDISDTNALKKILVKWETPVERENGDALYSYDIGGYEILWEKEGDNILKSVVIFENKSYMQTFYEIQNLAPGKYTFYMVCFDVNGLRSKDSERFTLDLK